MGLQVAVWLGFKVYFGPIQMGFVLALRKDCYILGDRPAYYLMVLEVFGFIFGYPFLQNKPKGYRQEG